MSRAPSPGRAAPLPLGVRSLWGALLVVVPGPVLRGLGGTDQGRAPRRVIRVLGARHLVQAGVEWRLGGRARETGVAVDALHAATALGFGVLDRRWRRAAFTDATIATAFIGLGLRN